MQQFHVHWGYCYNIIIRHQQFVVNGRQASISTCVPPCIQLGRCVNPQTSDNNHGQRSKTTTTTTTTTHHHHKIVRYARTPHLLPGQMLQWSNLRGLRKHAQRHACRKHRQSTHTCISLKAVSMELLNQGTGQNQSYQSDIQHISY